VLGSNPKNRVLRGSKKAAPNFWSPKGKKRQNMATSAALPPLPSEIYAVFNGPIDQEAVTRIFNGLTAASTNSVKQFHLLFQSQGGGIGESIALYNFFRALTFDLTLYNTGTVASGATIAYLGAKKRKTSAHALFMIHRTETTTQFANTQTIKSLADSAVINDQRTEAILSSLWCKCRFLDEKDFVIHSYRS
jgi:ATP-dependent protease ClpP protease subunit